jgi:hypothetical protein
MGAKRDGAIMGAEKIMETLRLPPLQHLVIVMSIGQCAWQHYMAQGMVVLSLVVLVLVIA